jgi:uncharacterized RDD family membrane protein YckC
MRFDEIELESVALGIEDEAPPVPRIEGGAARRDRRLLALLTDLSLFAAIVLALSPLLPPSPAWPHLAALAGFVVVLSYYYFVGTWLLWGKTIGGAIFDVRIIPEAQRAMSLRDASLRWAGVYLSLATAGMGFLLAALPSRKSLPDRLSHTRCV